MRAPGGLPLSPRQARVLALHAQGLIDKEIAAELGVSVRTVREHMHDAMTRLGSRTRAEAVVAALRRSELKLEGVEHTERPGERASSGPLPSDIE